MTSRIGQAAALHRQAAATVVAAQAVLDGQATSPTAPSRDAAAWQGRPGREIPPGQNPWQGRAEDDTPPGQNPWQGRAEDDTPPGQDPWQGRPGSEIPHLAERLRAAAAALAPGWLGAPLDAQSEDTPLGGPHRPRFVRIGVAQPLDDVRFPVVVPLLGAGHLAIDADARDPRVAGVLRAILLRLFAAAPAGSLLVRAVDAAGDVFRPFAALANAGLMAPPVTDRAGLRALLSEAEQWVRPARSGGHGSAAPRTRRPAASAATARRRSRDRTLLLVVASLPELTEGEDLTRIGLLAQRGPEADLHLIVAGWPPPPLTAETTQAPLPRTTQVTLRNPYALVGDPPGDFFGTPPGAVPPGAPPPTGLNSPVFLDEDPPVHLFERVCRELSAGSIPRSALRLADLLPAGDLWTEDGREGLATVVGRDGDTPLTLRFNDLTPHWLVGGHSAADRAAFLRNVLYGLATRYSPAELALYLLGSEPGVSFSEFAPGGPDATWLPHARAIGTGSDREACLAMLRDLDAEMARRSSAFELAGVTRFADLRQAPAPGVPRVVCVIDEFPVLLAGSDPLAAEAVGLLEALARRGRSYGIHLVLSGRTVLGEQAQHAGRDSLLGQFPVRVALPGGGDVLDPANDAAAALPLGSAVVNTAGGLGGPRGATRGHERTVRFPDSGTDRAALAALRRRLWERREAGSEPPAVFTGQRSRPLGSTPKPGGRPDHGNRPDHHSEPERGGGPERGA